MTKTAIEMNAIKSKEKIAKRDQDLREKEFKHRRNFDLLKGAAKAFEFGTKGIAKHLFHNDPSWYKNYIQDLDKYTNISTYVRNGSTYYKDLYNSGHNEGDNISVAGAVPGFCIFNWIPSINGYATSDVAIPSLDINQILMRTKEQVLKSNSRSNVPYEAADIGINVLATASILGAITEFERMVLAAQTYKADNAYYAEDAVYALGGNSSWLTNLADARKDLVLLKQRFNSALVAPAGISLYKKYVYLSSAWIKDSENHPASVYAYKCYRFLQLNATGDGLDAITPKRTTPSDFYNQISGMIQAIAENPDYRDMYQDLRSAIADTIQLDVSFDSNSQLEEIHDSMALEQITNVQTIPAIYSDDYYTGSLIDESVSIKQTNSGYLYQGTDKDHLGIRFEYETSEWSATPTTAIKQLGSGEQIINFHKSSITGDDVLDATRGLLSYTGIVTGEDQYQITVTSSDAVVVKCMEVLYRRIEFKADGTTSNIKSMIQCATAYLAPLRGTSKEFLDYYVKQSAFDWMPLVQFGETEESDVAKFVTLGDVQHLVPVSRDTLNRLNQACMLSLFYLDTDQFKR